MTLGLIYALLPLFWLLVNASKTQANLFSTQGLWFGGHFALFDNIRATFSYDHGVFLRWFGNTLLYVVAGAGGATVLATIAGYGLAKFEFPGKRIVFAVVLGAVTVPGTALAVPTFLMFSKLHLTNTPWAIIIPSLVNPLGLYLMWIYSRDAVPNELLEAVGGQAIYNLVITGSLLTIVPIVIAFLLMQRYWQSGLAAGSVKQ